jgi:hypothetical protein
MARAPSLLPDDDDAAEFIERRGDGADDQDGPVDLDPPPPPWVDPAKLPVRFSRLRNMARSGLHYAAACQGDGGDSLSRRLGSGAHAMLLGTRVVKWLEPTKDGKKIAPRSSKSKAWPAFKARNAGAVILTPSEWRAAERMVNAIKSHRLARELLEGASYEHEINWSHELGANPASERDRDGRACSSHLDVYRPGDLVADFKTARELDPDRFRKIAVWSQYHAQVAFYRQAAHRARGDRRDLAAWIIGVENTAPHDVICYELDAELLADGAGLCETWMRRLLACEADGVWPGRSAAAITLGRLDDDDAPPANFTIEPPTEIAA